MLSNICSKNVFIYVADSLRFDHLPVSITSLGLTLKTVASALSSPGSFASIVTGLHPTKHNVFLWQDHLLAPRVFDLESIETSFWDKDLSLRKVLNNPPSISLEEIRQPFIYIERDLIPHMPYLHDLGLSTKQYFSERGTTIEQIRADYTQAVNISADLFFRRLETLQAQNMLEDTLVIFTSDHGELLGEYGLIGHNSPACPELVYVPAVFIHPSISDTESFNHKIIRHVDILPTALGAIGLDPQMNYDGVNLTAQHPSDTGVNVHESKTYSVASAWDDLGGHIFLHRGLINNVLQMFARMISPHRSCLRFAVSDPRFISLYIRKYQSFGLPAFSKSQAQAAITSAKRGFHFAAGRQDLSKEIIDRLKDLGYLN
jgi:hypothetical protein